MIFFLCLKHNWALESLYRSKPLQSDRKLASLFQFWNLASLYTCVCIQGGLLHLCLWGPGKLWCSFLGTSTFIFCLRKGLFWPAACQRGKASLAKESQECPCLYLSRAQIQDVSTLGFYGLKSGGQTQALLLAKQSLPPPLRQASSLAPKLITKHDDFNTYSFTKRLHSCICDTCIYKLDTGKQLPQMARLIEKEKWLLGVTTTTTAQVNPETLSKEICKGLINLFL